MYEITPQEQVPFFETKKKWAAMGGKKSRIKKWTDGRRE